MIQGSLTIQPSAFATLLSRPVPGGHLSLTASPVYAVLQPTQDSPLVLSYNGNGDIDFNDYYLGLSSMWISNSTSITPNPMGTPDLLFQFNTAGEIEPVSR